MTITLKAEQELQRQAVRTNRHVYLVGGGIASLAAAAFLIRDGGILGKNITILEELDRLGGSLDGSGSPETGYIIRGGRMLESKYLCTFDLFSSIPTLDKSKSVTQEIFEWNEVIETSSHSRLIRNGQSIDGPKFELHEKHILKLEWLIVEPEGMLGKRRIEDEFDADFFETNFWYMWATTFAFQPWHSAVELKRYLARFTHMVEGFNRLHGIMRTRYNQFDSFVKPIHQWLIERAVNFQMSTVVTDLTLAKDSEDKGIVQKIHCRKENQESTIDVEADDLLIVTLGSMTESSSFGDNEKVAPLNGKHAGGAWRLWEALAAGRPEFGRPSVFADRIEESKWISTTTTLFSPDFFDFVRDKTGNIPGEGGLITFAESNWLCSIVLPAQPHFSNQPEDVNVFWAYGLYVNKLGNFVKKPMQECTGIEILTEILGHLQMSWEKQKVILQKSITIPCLMPFITSQFLTRERGDRPDVLPKGWKNLAFTGQFCEQPDDVVFTVEYSVRSAANAVYGLLGLDRKPPAVYKGQYNPKMIFRAFKGLHDM